MKKSILLAMFVGGVFAANAQNTNTTAGPATGNVTLNVNLYPLQSIVVNPSSGQVNLDYKTAADYLGGVNKTEYNHLTVFSTDGFDVKVKSTDTELDGAGTAIPLEDITITATQSVAGSTANTLDFTSAPKALTNGEQIIGSSSAAGSGDIDVNYKAAGNNEYLSRVVNGTTTVYTASLIYSIIAN